MNEPTIKHKINRPRGDLKYIKDDLYNEYKEAFIKGRRAYKYVINRHKYKKQSKDIYNQNKEKIFILSML